MIRQLGDFLRKDEDPDEMFLTRPMDKNEKRRVIEALNGDPQFRADVREALGLKRIDNEIRDIREGHKYIFDQKDVVEMLEGLK